MMNQEGNQASSKSMPGMDMGDNSNKTNDTLYSGKIGQSVTVVNLKTVAFQVSGNCEMCKDRIENVAMAIKGVGSADWKVADKMLRVKFSADKTNKELIQKAIAMAGHDTEKFKAPDDVYKKLPECCLYRK
jgi:Cu(I)/Ag(I) efflux system membrane fusion protein